jgi:hypothetical protein
MIGLLAKAVAAGGVLAPLKGTFNDAHGEWDEVKYGPIPVWRRDKKGRPRLLGIPFGRWIRGPRT